MCNSFDVKIYHTLKKVKFKKAYNDMFRFCYPDKNTEKNRERAKQKSKMCYFKLFKIKVQTQNSHLEGHWCD